MIFLSKYNGLKVVCIASRYTRDSNDNRMFIAGKHAKFENGMFETQDQEIIDILLKHSRYGLDFYAEKEGTLDATVNDSGKQERASEAAGLETTVHSCPKCSFKAKNKLGLMAHVRAKHPIE